MSFSSDVKNELVKQTAKSRHCQLAELAGILEMEGKLDENGILYIDSDNELLIQKYALLVKKAFDINISKQIGREDTIKILSALKLNEQKRQESKYSEPKSQESKSQEAKYQESMKEPASDMTSCTPINRRKTDGRLLLQTCCKRAFIRGAFMASGSMSDPNKSYHFEIVCHTNEQAMQLEDLLRGFDTDAKIVERKGHYVVYIKEGSQIVDCLNIMEAYVSLMNLENVRILKEMRNSVNRKVNCETANISKTVNAAVKQIEDIELIRQRIGLDNLPNQLREMAYLRLEYPDAPLKELGGYLDPPVGKSGVNHRLRKLSAIAEDLK